MARALDRTITTSKEVARSQGIKNPTIKAESKIKKSKDKKAAVNREKRQQASVSGNGTAPVAGSKICKKSGCNEPAKARGMCAKHYAEWYRSQN